MLVEEGAEVEAGQRTDEDACYVPHHIVVLELGARLGGHGEMAELAHGSEGGIADSEVVARIACAVAEGVFDGDVLD